MGFNSGFKGLKCHRFVRYSTDFFVYLSTLPYRSYFICQLSVNNYYPLLCLLPPSVATVLAARKWKGINIHFLMVNESNAQCFIRRNPARNVFQSCRYPADVVETCTEIQPNWTAVDQTTLRRNAGDLSCHDNLRSYQEVCIENVVRDISYGRYIRTFYCILLQIYVQTIQNCRMISYGSTPTSGFSIFDSPFLYFPRFPSSSLTIVFIWKLVVITFSDDKMFGLCIKGRHPVLSYLPAMGLLFFLRLYYM